MLIDAFGHEVFEKLDQRAAELVGPNKLYLLIDGAFVSGLHRMLAAECKSLLFASLPACSDEAADASPFLTPYVPCDKRMRSLLHRCRGWPMLSVIETSESLIELSERLSAWCIVEADGQRFNFRFADTRRLPAIIRTLDPAQRAQFLGPVVRWAFITRSGCWDEIEIEGAMAPPVINPVLNDSQFAALVDDSRADELLVLLGDRGYEVGKHPSVSYARMAAALQLAVSAELAEDNLVSWCIWFWRYAENQPDCVARTAFETWKTISLLEEQ